MKNILLTLLITIVAFGAAHAQIPNPGFENWDSTAGYKVPVGWDNLNPVTFSTSVLTCQRMDPGHTDAFYLALNTQTVPGMGILPGIAVSGKLDPVTHLPKSGFPFTMRPQVLAGAWQYMPYTTADQPFFAILLSKWNISASQRDTIAYTQHLLPGMVMSWTDFAIPLTYYSSANPDSAMIVLSASGPAPVAYSFLWVDDLRFTDSATLGNHSVQTSTESISLYPNPASGYSSVSCSSTSFGNATITILDPTGRMIKKERFTLTPGKNELPINTGELSPGLYLLNFNGTNGTYRTKLIITQ